MNAVFFIQITLLVISSTLSVIFFMAWQTMGKKKYTLIWAATFLIISIQRTFNIAKAEIAPYELYWMIVCALSMASVVMGAWGHFLRTHFRLPIKYLVYGSVVFLGLTFYFTVVAPHVGLRMSLYIFWNAALLLFVGVVIYRFRPKPKPAEIGASVSYVLLGVFQLGAAVFAFLQGQSAEPVYREFYTFVNLVSLPAAFTAMGLFTVFMLASDLSEEMKELAMTDSLTRCLNRRGFYQLAQRRIANMLDQSKHVCLIYWDIDNFKSINDNYGHNVGDQVLIEAVEQVRTHIKQDDLIGRLGGEEFVMLLGRIDIKEATQVAERVRSLLEEHKIACNGQSIQFTASFGVVFIHDNQVSVEAAIDSADKALYRAKTDGRNQVVIAAAV